MAQDPTIRVLATAFAPVPGSSPHAMALIGMAKALRAELDLITIKTEQLPHVDRIGDARMFRVPIGHDVAAEQRETFNRAVHRQLQSETYDVVHVRGPYEGAVVAHEKGTFGYRFVYEVATWPDEGEGTEVEEEWARAHEQCLEHADLILVPTRAAARSLAERGHGGKAAVIHPGVDVNAFDWWPGGHDDTTRLMYLGSFAADRDLHTLLNAIRTLKRHRPVQALVAGDQDPDRRARLRRIVKAFDLSDEVVVRGEPRAIALPTLISAADVCIASAAATPRFQDMGDVPQPLLEYLACRRPVVAAGVPGIAEILRDEKEGLLYPPGDESTLADSVATLMGQDTLRERLVESAYDRVRWQFSDGARRRRIAEVYEMLVPGSQRYDAWMEGFTHESTGMVHVPTQLFELERELEGELEDTGDYETTGGDVVIAPLEQDTSDIAVAPDPDQDTDDHPTPAQPSPLEPDTSPGLYPPDETPADLPNVPTRIDQPPSEDRTDPARSTDHDTEH